MLKPSIPTILKGICTEPKLQQMKYRCTAALRQSITFDTRIGPMAFIWKFHKRFWAFTLDRAVSACLTSSVSQSVNHALRCRYKEDCLGQKLLIMLRCCRRSARLGLYEEGDADLETSSLGHARCLPRSGAGPGVDGCATPEMLHLQWISHLCSQAAQYLAAHHCRSACSVSLQPHQGCGRLQSPCTQ